MYIYRIAGNIGGELYLADWRISCHAANIKSANCANCVDSRRRHGDRTVTAKFISANCNVLPFSSNPPNIIPANISGYMVYSLLFLRQTQNKLHVHVRIMLWYIHVHVHKCIYVHVLQLYMYGESSMMYIHVHVFVLILPECTCIQMYMYLSLCPELPSSVSHTVYLPAQSDPSD